MSAGPSCRKVSSFEMERLTTVINLAYASTLLQPSGKRRLKTWIQAKAVHSLTGHNGNLFTYNTTNMKKRNEKSYDVISPDGFSIHLTDTYPTKKAAWDAFEEWKKGYEAQGYYSSNRGRIPLEDLADFCSLVEV